MTDALRSGVDDRTVTGYATEHGSVVPTNDDDFPRPTVNTEVRVLYYGNDDLDATEIVDRVDRVAECVPDPDDLTRITGLGDWG